VSLTDVIELILYNTFADRKISFSDIYNLKTPKDTIQTALGNAERRSQRHDKEVTDLHHGVICVACTVCMLYKTF
jgi:hypothetical protein